MKINNYYLIILTALFSSLSLIMDQTVFQIEKRIINLETNLSDDKNNIAISNSKYSYFNKSFQKYSLTLETILANLNKDKNFRLKELADAYNHISYDTEQNYLYPLFDKTAELRTLSRNRIFEEKDTELKEKTKSLGKYFFRIKELHLENSIFAEKIMIKNDDNINGLRSLRQIIIVLAFSLNICALMSLLYYFKNILLIRLIKQG